MLSAGDLQIWKPRDSDNKSRKRVCRRAFCRVLAMPSPKLTTGSLANWDKKLDTLLHKSSQKSLNIVVSFYPACMHVSISDTQSLESPEMSFCQDVQNRCKDNFPTINSWHHLFQYIKEIIFSYQGETKMCMSSITMSISSVLLTQQQ